MLTWERLDSRRLVRRKGREPHVRANNPRVLRTRVLGGWLVFVANDDNAQAGLTFYPDPSHAWEPTELESESAT